ncbi:MAG: hypothetical protein P9X26_01955 [Candidatus Stygibacter frigidus]|nr:hypothetical protein [Candidatus Stygibacter frigidus]
MMQKVLTVVTVIFITIQLAAGIPQKVRLDAAKVNPIMGCPELMTNTLFYLNWYDCGFYNLDLSNNEIDRYLQLWKPNTSFTQKFYLVQASQDSYYIVKAQQDQNLHIISEQAGEDNHLRIGGELNSTTDLWKIVSDSDEGLYYIISEYNGNALTSYAEADTKDQIMAKEYTGSIYQKW